MPGGQTGRQDQRIISASIPVRLIARVKKILDTHDEWVNMSDFVREAMAEKANAVDAADRAKRPDAALERSVVDRARMR